ncbi:assimilatory sulfite reductase (NADPH) flavoprotein subunit [Paenibacillus antarcticus]|uniref:assimilatory sulfite reductase (NADPH) n=1 Tax=Paenibacillus antarcticus TaxID=253703 RepID=A0A168QG22_9BACL|nr:assimilatory sulfite reductase (NADPH) flavoprotein subunit [Paenibacillus antarcticus]OAB40194.1 sulfite reductase [NADPH] flavoprotein alpha-component [Paenibacillus antarcticus]OAB47744.1 sulfite reductase [NADPH] flavoprotein alpha-component [Paenibacillus antarcticus]
MQFQVMNSPFSQEQVELLNRLVPTLTESQQIWLSGYFTATQNSNTTLHTATEVTTVITTDSPVAISREVTVLFGSQTGNSQGLAKALTIKLEQLGFQVTLSSMSDFKSNTLKKVKNLLIVASTHGEGTPPDNAIPFYEFLHSKRAPQLEDLQFSVLALGDSSYEFYCQTGKDFDKRLEELGGKRLSTRVDCDLDYDDSAADWIENVLANLNKKLESTGPAQGTTLTETGTVAEQSAYSRTSPFKAEVLENLNLNGRGSDRETRHLELSLEGSNFHYEPGDCVGIYPENSLSLVESLIENMGWKPEELVSVNKKGEERSLREALLNNFEITVLTKPLLEQAAKLSSNKSLEELVEPGHEVELRNYLDGRDLLDLVQDFSPWKGTVQEFVSILRKMPPRLYSIASSSKARPDEVHLTIRTVQYESHGRERYGVCSTQCAERLEPGEQLSMYIHHNPNFKLPANSDTPIIMIGPGTGVAPFRAFLEEREESSAEGKAWLFYGDQHLLTDFLYQLDFQRWVKEGVLTRMDVAFSRDTDKKVYVQHRMLEKSRELYQWLENGASVYICGDEKHMAHDVHNTLITILEQEGGKSTEEAVAYLNDMQQQKRYQRDVY